MLQSDAAALGGELPTLTWSTTFIKSGTYTGITASGGGVNVLATSAAGNVVLNILLLRSASDFDSRLLAINPDSGNSIWAVDCAFVTLGQRCRDAPVTFDLAGRVYGARLQRDADGTTEQSSFFIRFANNGTIVAGSEIVADFDTPWTDAASRNCIDSGIIESGQIRHFACGSANNRNIGFDDNLTTEIFNAGTGTGPTSTYWDPESNTLLTSESSGGSYIYRKRNVTTGATIGGTISNTRNSANGWILPSQNETNRAFSAGHDASNRLVYSKINISAWALVTSNQLFTPSQINDGGLRSTSLFAWDLDGANNMLICGSYVVGAETRGFFGHFKTSNNTMHWNRTFDLGSTTQVVDCDLDGFGRIYVAIQYTNAAGDQRVDLRRYDGGEFIAKTPRQEIGFVLPTVTPTPTPGVLPPLDEALIELGEVIGATNTKGKFIWGLVLVLAVIFFCAAAAHRFAINPIVPSLVGGIGMMVAVGILGLWPNWTIVVIGLIAAAVITWIVTKVTGGFN